MDQDTSILLGYAFLVVLNRAIFVGGFAVLFRPAFYILQLLNIAACSFFLAWGIPAFTENMQVVNYMLGGILLLRTVTNNQRYAKLLRASKSKDDEARLAQRQAVLDKLKAEEGDLEE